MDFFGRSKAFFWIALIVAFIIFINLPLVRDLVIVKSITRATLTITYPVQATLSWIGGTSQFVGNLATLGGAQGENAMLRASLEALQARLNNYEELASENSQLRADLRYVQSNFNFNLLGARVISQSSNPLVSSITIDKGEQNGVKINQAVIAPEGLVGKIIETSPFSSQVLLLTDPTNTVAVMIQQTRNVGVATGGVMGQLNLKFLSVDLELEKDQTVVTTGSEIYPAGIMVGKISKVTKSENMLFLNVKINPAVKLSKLARVFVVRR